MPFLMMNRMGLTVLLHPQSGRPRDDHTINAVWMGEVLPVKTEVLRESDYRVALLTDEYLARGTVTRV